MTRPEYHVVSWRRVNAATAVFRKTMVGPLLLLVLLAFFLPSFPSAAAECPAKCMCFKTTVRCMYLNLDRIPDRISPTTTVLECIDLARYLIKVLRSYKVAMSLYLHEWSGTLPPFTFMSEEKNFLIVVYDSISTRPQPNLTRRFLSISDNTSTHISNPSVLDDQKMRLARADFNNNIIQENINYKNIKHKILFVAEARMGCLVVSCVINHHSISTCVPIIHEKVSNHTSTSSTI
ncbi:hypothetical protein AGLY_009639 [Aphis glycines]|uniref:LRRNT domain-containing protein n=1 Tax=Aphis glycines TaxID=307491 RepID=A0A6G0TIM9_APHGL|nr:hypothetical protein AGLY_009639 [Aphis glycines]